MKSPKILRSRTLFPTLVVAIFLSVTLLGCADRLLLFPSRGELPHAGILRREIAFSDGQLEIWTARTAAATDGMDLEGFALAFCGNGSRAESLAPKVSELFGNRRLAVWALNYPGYGGSSGKAKLNLLAPAGLAAYDALALIAKGKPIFIFGESMGNTVGLYVASKRSVAGLILESPPPLRRMILQRYGWWNLWLVALPVAYSVPSELNATGTAPEVHAPGIFITSMDDGVVPRKYQDLVYEAYAGTKQRLFRPGGHNDGFDAAAVEKLRAALAEIWPQ